MATLKLEVQSCLWSTHWVRRHESVCACACACCVCLCVNTVGRVCSAVPFTEGTVGRYVGTISTDKSSMAYLPSDF